MDILTIRDVVSGYGEKMIVKGISFSVGKGEFLGIIGPNGAGKSTLLNTVSRVIHPRSGNVSLDGRDIYNMPLKEFAKSVAFVTQGTVVAFAFTALEIALMGRSPYLRLFQDESRRDIDIVRRALTVTDCGDFINRPIDQLSAGERQRIFIAKALAQEPRLILLDEPTAHLDITHQVGILDLIKRLNRELGLTVIMVLHDLNLASEYCQRLILINDGRIHKMGRPEEVLNYDVIEEVYKTVVVVEKSPISSKPYILLVSEEERQKRAKRTY